MKKAIVIIFILVLIIVTILGYKIYDKVQKLHEIKVVNTEYESFYNKEILGTDLASLINKVDDINNKNNLIKGKKEKSVSSTEALINLEVKFLELDDVISYEKIERQGINQFVQNFGAFKFKCTKLEHNKFTGNVQYMYFEQVEN